MANWVLHRNPALEQWIIVRAREHIGLRQSFDAACAYAEDDKNWANRSGDYAFIDYLPAEHPFTYPMILKIRVDRVYITAVAIFVEKNGLCKIA